ncbi:MAG: hypothetical protein IPO92_08600 [Saprospiraceae bacterium]|nr:hypothetical protein [Saprospiraceae bacterium]
MKDRKIISALSTLNIYELNSFRKYVHSPYFNVNESITTYFDQLYKLIKQGLDDIEFSNESLWTHVYPGQAYQNQKFLKLNSDLVKLLEDFLAQQEFDQMTSLRSNLKLEGARKKSLDKLYNGLIGEIERLQKMDLNQSVEYYYNQYLVEKSLFSLKTENEKKNVKSEIETELNIGKISENLDYFYVAEKLRLYCTLLSWKKMYQLDIEIENMEMVLTKATEENIRKCLLFNCTIRCNIPILIELMKVISLT